MGPNPTINPAPSLTPEAREHLRREIVEASEPIAPFWPMRTMVAQNPIHGLEYLSFDQAVRKGKHLLGGNGYLSNEEYRQFHRDGRITSDSFKSAFARVGPRQATPASIQVGRRQITAHAVWQLHVLFGFEELQPSLLEWELSGGGTLKQFRQDLSPESRKRIIDRTIQECELCREYPEEAYLTNLWNSTLAALGLSEGRSGRQPSGNPSSEVSEDPRPSANMALPAQRTISDWVDALADTELVEQINHQLIKWIAAFVDEGLAGWEMPQREKGFYQAWRQLARQDFSGKLLGIKDFTQKIHDLPADPEEAISWSLHRLGVPQEQWKDYLSRQLSLLPGWTRYIRWLGEHPTYHAQHRHPIDTTQYLAVRLFYEAELTQVTCQREWGIDGTAPTLVAYWNDRLEDDHHRIENVWQVDHTKQATCRDAWRLFHIAQFLELSPIEVHDLSPSDAQTFLDWLDDFPADQHSPVWLEAYEDSFRADILKKISAHRGTTPALEIRPHAQLVLCIDVRSESFRRHIEAQGPYETFGFAGFFAIPLSHQAFDNDQRAFLCPVLLTPNHAVTETPRPGEETALEQYTSGTRWHELGHHVFHDLKHHPIGSMMVIDVLGFFFSLGLVGKTLVQKPFHALTSTIEKWFTHRVPTEISVSAPTDSRNPKIGEVNADGIPQDVSQGFTLEERATCIENGLRAMGLTHNYARLVCLCGHGSETDNNPYYGALDCGACGGSPGDANARVFATMANEPAVRRILKENGLPIPDDTWFLPGKHNTTTDRVEFYDLEALPDTHQEDLRALNQDLEAAGANQALERCQRIPRAPTEISPARGVRSCRRTQLRLGEHPTGMGAGRQWGVSHWKTDTHERFGFRRSSVFAFV